jgi:hypothetical protein
MKSQPSMQRHDCEFSDLPEHLQERKGGVEVVGFKRAASAQECTHDIDTCTGCLLSGISLIIKSEVHAFSATVYRSD